MSSEAHEPCAIRIRYGDISTHPTLWLWECTTCRAPFGCVCGHIPYACPSCGVSFTVYKCRLRYFTRAEIERDIRDFGPLVGSNIIGGF